MYFLGGYVSWSNEIKPLLTNLLYLFKRKIGISEQKASAVF